VGELMRPKRVRLWIRLQNLARHLTIVSLQHTSSKFLQGRSAPTTKNWSMLVVGNEILLTKGNLQ
jgi:hypothetical protein